MTTTAHCRLRQTGTRWIVERLMFDSHGLAVGNGYYLDNDSSTEWEIIEILANGNRDPLCIAFDAFLDQIIADQNTGDGKAHKVLAADHGMSLTHLLMEAADLRRKKLGHAKRAMGDQDEKQA